MVASWGSHSAEMLLRLATKSVPRVRVLRSNPLPPPPSGPPITFFCLATQARPATAAFSRGMAGAIKVLEVDQETKDFLGPAEVARSEERMEMGVLYAPGVPSPMEGAYHHEPIVVDGLVAKTGGSALGCPVQYIKLSAWDTTPVECKYTGLRFVSKKALEAAAKK